MKRIALFFVLLSLVLVGCAKNEISIVKTYEVTDASVRDTAYDNGEIVNFVEYYEMSDGSYMTESGDTYKYRLVITGRMNAACSLKESDSAKHTAERTGFPSRLSARPHSAQAAYRLSHWANIPPLSTTVGSRSTAPKASRPFFLPASFAQAPARKASPRKDTAFTAYRAGTPRRVIIKRIYW